MSMWKGRESTAKCCKEERRSLNGAPWISFDVLNKTGRAISRCSNDIIFKQDEKYQRTNNRYYRSSFRQSTTLCYDMLNTAIYIVVFLLFCWIKQKFSVYVTPSSQLKGSQYTNLYNIFSNICNKKQIILFFNSMQNCHKILQ